VDWYSAAVEMVTVTYRKGERLVLFMLSRDLGPLLTPNVSRARLRPRPRNLLIKFLADSVKCLDTMSPALTSSFDLRAAISVRILPPASNISSPLTWSRSTGVGGPSGRDYRKNYRSRVLAELRAVRSRDGDAPFYKNFYHLYFFRK